MGHAGVKAVSSAYNEGHVGSIAQVVHELPSLVHDRAIDVVRETEGDARASI